MTIAMQRLKMKDLKTPAEFVFFCVVLLHGLAAALNCSSPTPKSLFKALEESVLSSSNKHIRPVNNITTPTDVSVHFTIVGILGVNEKAQTLTTFIWQILEWDIEGLSWDERECGTRRVSVPRENLWVPDIRIAELTNDISPNTPFVYLDNKGHVYDDRPVRAVTSCHMEIFRFPFDTQNCTLTFGSYLHYASDVRLVMGSTAQEIYAESRDVILTRGEWDLREILVQPSTLAVTEGSFSELEFHMVLRRNPILYVVNLLAPSCFLITVDLFSFLLPLENIDRSTFKMILIQVFLLIMIDLLPTTAKATPLINVFFSISLAMMVVSLLETVFITNIKCSSRHHSAMPRWLRTVVLKYLAYVVCLPPKPPSNRVTVTINPEAHVTVNSKDVQHGPANGEPRIYITAVSQKTLNTPGSPLKPHPADPLKPPPADPLTLSPAMEELRRLSRDLHAIRMQMDRHLQDGPNKDEWHKIGLVLDRLLFGFYIVFLSASFITIGCFWIKQ